VHKAVDRPQAAVVVLGDKAHWVSRQTSPSEESEVPGRSRCGESTGQKYNRGGELVQSTLYTPISRNPDNSNK
jgi:hypothetical protein